MLGPNDVGQLGNGGQTDYNSPTLTSGFGPGTAVAVSAGGTHTCAILTTVQSVVGDMGDTGNSGTPFTVGITDSHQHSRTL